MPESRSHFKWDFWTFVIIGVLGVFMLFLIYPLFTLFLSGFQDPYTGRFSMVNFAKFFHKRYYYRSLFNSFKVTTAVTLLAVLIGTPMAWFMSSFRIRAKRLLDVLIIISMLSPPFIGAYSWILLCGRSGVVTQTLSKVFNCEWPSIYGFGGILLVLTLKLYPFIYLYVSGALKKIDSSLSEAAESLGCSGARKVVTVVMPLIMPTLLAGALMVFMNALADFGTPMLIGEGYSTMPVQIYSEFISEVGETANFPAAMSVIMVLVTTVIFSLQKYIINRKSFVMSSLRPMHAKEISGFKSLLVHGYIWLVVALSLVPQVTVIYTTLGHRGHHRARHADSLPHDAQEVRHHEFHRQPHDAALRDPRFGAGHHAAASFQQKAAAADRHRDHHDRFAGDPQIAVHAALEFGNPLSDQPQHRRGLHQSRLLAGQDLLARDRDHDAARRALRRYPELDHGSQRTVQFCYTVRRRYQDYVGGHLLGGHPRQLRHGCSSLHAADDRDGGFAFGLL